MAIIPEAGPMDRQKFGALCELVTKYLDTNHGLVITVAERSFLYHDNDTQQTYDLIRKQQSGHGITEGNYMADLMSRYFEGTGSHYRATDDTIGYRSRFPETR